MSLTQVGAADSSVAAGRGPVAVGGDTSMLVAALRYAEYGIAVFPLAPNRKPLANCRLCNAKRCGGPDRCTCDVSTCHAFYAATTNTTVITQWWTNHPKWQIGMRTGAGSNIVALDVDVDAEGLDSLRALENEGLDHAGCGWQLSGSRQSFHLLFTHPGGRVRCSQGRLGPGLDVRGDGGYLVAAPSIHSSTGAAYVMHGPLTGLPAWPLTTETAANRRRARSTDHVGSAVDVPDWLEGEQDEPMCARVVSALDDMKFGDGAGSRHNAARRGVLRLLRMRQQGHAGVAKALEVAQAAFVSAVTKSRTEQAATQEFEQLVSAGWRLLSLPREPQPHSACSCQLADLRQAREHGQGLSKGIAGVTELKVLRYLLMIAERKSTLLIAGQSQRRMSEAIDVHQPTVSKALERMERAGVLKRRTRGGSTTSASYLLAKAPTRMALSEENPETAGMPTDTSMRAYVHSLFGSSGLGGSVSSTFAALSELETDHGESFMGVRVRPGSRPSAGLEDPYVGQRQIPRPASPAEGRTPVQLSQMTGRQPSTTRRHLKRLEAAGLAFVENGVWWRNRYDPAQVADELGIVDTPARKSRAHEAQRRAHLNRLCEASDSDEAPVLMKEDFGGHPAYVWRDSGEVFWVDLEGELPKTQEAG